MEPKLPKLPKSKIKPNIQPNKIIGGGKVTYGGAKSKGVNPLIRNITSSDNLSLTASSYFFPLKVNAKINGRIIKKYLFFISY